MDKTVLKIGQPLFAIGTLAYSRASASKGFFEALKIAEVSYDPARKTWVYAWERSFTPNKRPDLSPVQITESELINVCEASKIQLSVLLGKQKEIQAQVTKFCKDNTIVTTPRRTYEADGVTQPPVPLYGDQEVVYLRETAEVIGRLEAYHITAFSWRNDIKQWVYGMHIRRRPGRNMTVGDRVDLTREFDLTFPESELCKLCEALPLALSYLNKAVLAAQLRVTTYCGTA